MAHQPKLTIDCGYSYGYILHANPPRGNTIIILPVYLFRHVVVILADDYFPYEGVYAAGEFLSIVVGYCFYNRLHFVVPGGVEAFNDGHYRNRRGQAEN
jgi:hypothetical protein